eukprot:COSAG01_NODE_34260_length_550_cov_1.818182_2_plen_31_part_01
MLMPMLMLMSRSRYLGAHDPRGRMKMLVATA